MRILLVDPSRTVLKIVSQLLEAAGHEARSFMDGSEALTCLKSDPEIDALITSLELPSISGIELCREARLLSNYRRPMYIVLMSSNYEQRRIAEALDSGADDFIGKPPATEELYARLRAAERLTSTQRELVKLATTDPLTGVLNRRAFFEKAEEICARARIGTSLSAIMFDIDRFKQINDRYGHGIGDDVIRTAAREAALKSDIIGRLGGEEFAILLREQTGPDALGIAEQLRTTMAQLELKSAGKPVRFTCSFGVDEWVFGDTIDGLLRRADMALYEAKAGGRNRVVAYRPTQSAAARGTGIIRWAAR